MTIDRYGRFHDALGRYARGRMILTRLAELDRPEPRRRDETREAYTARVRANTAEIRDLVAERDRRAAQAQSRTHRARYPVGGYRGPDWYEKRPKPATVNGRRTLVHVAPPGESLHPNAFKRAVVPASRTIRTAARRRATARQMMSRR